MALHMSLAQMPKGKKDGLFGSDLESSVDLNLLADMLLTICVISVSQHHLNFSVNVIHAPKTTCVLSI